MIGKRNKYQGLFTQSGCLTKEALDEYIDSSLSSDEMHIVEEHISKCDLCADAVEGVKLISKPASVKSTIEEINSKLKSRISQHSVSGNHKTRQISDKILYISVAATVILLVGWLIFLNLNKPFGLDKITVITNTESSQKIPPAPLPKVAGISSIHDKELKKPTEELALSNSKEPKNEITESSNKDLLINTDEQKREYEEEQPIAAENIVSETDQLVVNEDLGKSVVFEESSEASTMDIASNQPVEYYMGEVIIMAEKANLKNSSFSQTRQSTDSELTIKTTTESVTNQRMTSRKKSQKDSGEKESFAISENEPASIHQNSRHFFKIIDSMPEFPGGIKEMTDFLKLNLQYPGRALENHLEGTLYVSFIVEEDGKLSDFSIIRSPGDDFNAEALRVLKLMPEWIPGYKDGKPIRVQISLPIKFLLL
jgi:TonB family protein